MLRPFRFHILALSCLILFVFTVLLALLTFDMPRASFLQASALLSSVLVQASQSATPTQSGWSTTLAGTPTSFRSVFTIPASADVGANIIPNILDPQAVNAQDVCPGYKASQLQESNEGITAVLNLAGPACNVYGNDIETLNLKVEYQSKDRLAVNIRPAHLDASNSSQWIIPENLIPRPQSEGGHADLDLKFEWSNEPSFWFSVKRQSSGDIIFTTEGSPLVYEDQFVEFVNSLPEDYNLYGLGERIHGLRLNNSKFGSAALHPIEHRRPPVSSFYSQDINTDRHQTSRPPSTLRM